jgi:hypothetical protein
MIDKTSIKRALGDIPLTAEAYWLIRQGGKPPSKSFSFDELEKSLPDWCEQAQKSAAYDQAAGTSAASRKILVFCTLRYWINYCSLLSIALSGLGHQVTFAYLPYANWWSRKTRFNIRQQNAYARKVLKLAGSCIQPVSLYDLGNQLIGKTNGMTGLPPALEESIREISLRDAQYTLQVEEIDREDDDSETGHLYQLRLERNHRAAQTIYEWLRNPDSIQRPDIVIMPNGSILEMGAVFQTARHLDIPTVTFEFGEQRGRIWFDLDHEVMFQNTDDMWNARKNTQFTDHQKERVGDLYTSRQNASLWNNFSRLWQDQPGQGGEDARKELGLDERPLVLLAANVIGDSLTLGRQVFSRNMTEWLERTILKFADREDTQLVIRVHPGEKYTQGPSVAELVRRTLPEIPEHIRLIAAEAKVNTYDLIEIADLGLVYTTTVGMEMAMSGIPVIATGHTHYRGKGFTLDPDSWQDYFDRLDEVLDSPADFALSNEQLRQVWHYAYCFFFEYPCPFPWHLRDFWDEIEKWDIETVLGAEGQAVFGDVFRYLTGERRDWSKPPALIPFTSVEQEISVTTRQV